MLDETGSYSYCMVFIFQTIPTRELVEELEEVVYHVMGGVMAIDIDKDKDLDLCAQKIILVRLFADSKTLNLVREVCMFDFLFFGNT